MINKKEIERLELITPFYEKGDKMDEMMIDREIEFIKAYEDKTKCVLEVGCGNGYSTERLEKLFPNYTVIEPSIKNIELTQKKTKNVFFVETLLEDLKLEGKFDYIFFLNIIEHVEDPIDSLKRLIPLLEDDGKIFISCPNCMSLNRRIGLKTGMLKEYSTLAEKDILVGHRQLYTVDMLKDHCDKAGLKVIEMKGIYPKPLSEKQMSELSDEILRAYHQIGEEIPEYCATLFAIATKKYY
jgi:2-polyprenyl-3-methyl-5-hydroxy-6-metoxy-1,4-benzoquinol methylase